MQKSSLFFLRRSGLCTASVFGAGLLALAGTTNCAATVLFDNLAEITPGDSIGTVVGQSLLTGSTPIALSNLVIADAVDYTAHETFGVYSRNDDGTIGSSLFTDFALTYDATGQLLTTTANSAFTLQPDTGYWFVLSSTTSDYITWEYTLSTTYTATAGVTPPDADSAFSNGPYGDQSNYFAFADGPQIFQLNGAVVPEPSTWALLALSAVGAGMATLRRRANPAQLSGTSL